MQESRAEESMAATAELVGVEGEGADEAIIQEKAKAGDQENC